MKTFLKEKNIELDGETIIITQLSGLDRFDFLDYCTDLPKPMNPQIPAEEASIEDKEAYLEAAEANIKTWQRVSFTAQSRLVAHGCLEFGGELEERHKSIMSSMTPEQVKYLHDEIASFSGIPLPEPVGEATDEDASLNKESQEPTDPKD